MHPNNISGSFLAAYHEDEDQHERMILTPTSPLRWGAIFQLSV